jgi:phage-related protein (TIGR01555 family)
MDTLTAALTPFFDGFNAVLNKVKAKTNYESSLHTNQSLSNKEIDRIVSGKQLLLRQIEIPAYFATQFYPIFDFGSDLKSRKMLSFLRKENWLLKFQKAIALANRYGAAYIILTTAGETDLSLPLKLNPVSSTRLLTQEELIGYRQPDMGIDYGDPEYYMLKQYGMAKEGLVHSSRVIALYGKQRSAYDLKQHNNRHSPIWLPTYPLFLYYEAALETSLSMLKDSSIGVYKIMGLTKMLATAKTQDCKDQLTKDLYGRISTLLDGMSVMKKIVLDMEQESFEFVERDFSNVEKIVAVFKTAFAEVCDLPSTVLFSSNTEEGLFSDVGMADRQLLASHVNSFQNLQLTPALNKLIACQMRSYDLDYSIEYPSTIVLTEAEKAELFYKQVNSHTALLASEVGTPRMIAKRYQGQVIDTSLSFTDEELAKIPDEIQERNIKAEQGAQGQKGGNTNNQNSAGFKTKKSK